MGRVFTTVLKLAAALIGAVSSLAGATEICTGMPSAESGGLIVSRGSMSEFSLKRLAEDAAPCIALSPGEPVGFPTVWPANAQEFRSNFKALLRASRQGKPAVYYNIREFKVASGASLTADTERELNRLKNDVAASWPDGMPLPELSARIRYFFYFLDEVGFSQHTNDLESAEVKLLVRENVGHYSAQLIAGEGAAHGLGWYTNTVDFTKFSQLNGDYRPVVFIEEGKHAVAFDVNRNGVFQPGFDVNVNYEDAWGIRDNMAYTRSLSPTFKAEFFSSRPPSEFKRPETIILAYKSPVCEGTYLRDLDGEKPVTGKPWESVVHLTRGKKFCAEPKLRLPPRNLPGRAWKRVDGFAKWIGFGGVRNSYSNWWERIPLGIRFDQGWGWTAGIPIGPKVPVLGGQFVFRLNGPWPRAMTTNLRLPDSNLKNSGDIVYSTSATRSIGWYALGGQEQKFADPPTGKLPEAKRGYQVAWETGIRFRFPIPRAGIFLGGRLGYRFNNGVTSAAINHRLVMDFGGGGW